MLCRSAVYSFAIHPSGKLALSSSKDKTLRTWNLITGRCAYVSNIKEGMLYHVLYTCIFFFFFSKFECVDLICLLITGSTIL